jgi:hypothetical protein
MIAKDSSGIGVTATFEINTTKLVRLASDAHIRIVCGDKRGHARAIAN